ncbi:protein TolR [Candidatus Odyssella thessalonicensis]|uniref:protein TolR n=1 Tax=Candidatus Odyssella thessalonicensis TaxID=84647 RepID=UPI000225B1C3|nr:protein TolR [Candidatus Odyssella thessalonicensis]
MGMASLNTSPRKGRRRSSAGFSEINVTPLVDVMLVLLIIFMVAAPMLTVGVPVDLPKTKAAKMNDQVEPVVVSVDASGRTFLQETAIGDEGLIARLMAITSNNPDARIYVRGDQSLAYGRVMEVMGEIAAAGFTKVSLIAEMPTATKAAPAPHASLSVPRQSGAVPHPAAKVPTLQQLVPPSAQHLPSARPNLPQNSQRQGIRPQGQALPQRPPLPRPSGG